jgi:pyruvate-formate lyase
MTIYILEGEEIVGNYASSPVSLPTHPEFSYRWLEEALDNEFKDALDDNGKKRLKEINKYWQDDSIESKFLKAAQNFPDELKPGIGWTGAFGVPWEWPLGCAVLNYELAFEEGLNGILAEVRNYRSMLSAKDPEYKEKQEFYQAAEICAGAVMAFARRFATLAKEKADDADGEQKERYERIARICSRIPDNPPETFHDALQAFWFYHLITTQIDWNSVGLGQRFDQLFWRYYKKDKLEGRITYEGAVELFEHLWIKLDDLGQINPWKHAMLQVGGTKFQSATLGGVDRYGNDATNELSFAMIDATMNIRTLQPSLSLRYHEYIDPKIVDKAVECIATGIGMPAIFNDRPVISWMLNTAMSHFYPENGKFFGAAGLPIIKKVHDQTKKAVSFLPKSWEEGLEDYLHNWPYKMCTAGGRIGDIMRGLAKRTGFFDADEVLHFARNWSNTACVGPGFTGMAAVQGTLASMICCAIFNYAKCLEYVLYQGVEPTTGEQLGARTPDPCTLKTYEEFLEAFLVQVKYALEQAAKIYEISEKLYAEAMPRPLPSILVGKKSCIRRGKDITRKGDLGYSEVFLAGSVNTADSLTVIKKLVYEDKSVTMNEMIGACRSNWQSCDRDLRRKCLSVPKFGNDDDYADLVLEEMYRKTVKVFKEVNDHFGNHLVPEATMAGGYFAMGACTGATPDGRLAHETLSDGQLSPMHGRDKKGPTAVLKSCSKVDPTRCGNQLFNQKFLPSALKGKNKKLFANYLKTWSGFGNWHIQFNCIDVDTLREAQAHPEKHANLIVRVAGYSAFYTELNPEIQTDIIRRSEQDLAPLKC